jgi:hypothetical protein
LTTANYFSETLPREQGAEDVEAERLGRQKDVLEPGFSEPA